MEYLSLDDLAIISSAIADGQPVVISELARQLGRPYFTVHKAAQRLRRAGGWYTRLSWSVCSECGRDLAMAVGHPRIVHPWCKRDRDNRQAREDRLQNPGESTPYVRAWRQRNPETLSAMREAEKAKRREIWPDLPEEKGEESLAKVHAADARDYPITAAVAASSGDPWTSEEDRYVLEHLAEPAREVGITLGRSLWAVRHRRVRLRRMSGSN